MTKKEKIQEERARLGEVVKDVDKTKRDLLDKLLDDAAFLAVENQELRDILEITGSVKIHPQDPTVQKPVEAARQYRQNLNTYAVIIKTLNGIVAKDGSDEDDPFLEWVKSRKERKDGEQGRLTE